MVTRTIIIYLNKRKVGDFIKEALLFIFYVYLLCILSIHSFPYTLMNHHIRLSVNLIPVVGTIKDIAQTTNSPYMIRIWIRNIVECDNIIACGSITFVMSQFRKVGRVTLFAFLFSLGIETLQLLLTLMGNIGRAFDVDDILLNTLGAFIGVSLYSICNRIAGSEPEPGEKYSCHGDRPRGR